MIIGPDPISRIFFMSLRLGTSINFQCSLLNNEYLIYVVMPAPHARDSTPAGEVPFRVYPVFYSWIPGRASLARNDSESIYSHSIVLGGLELMS
jgi:hypothetical protein